MPSRGLDERYTLATKSTSPICRRFVESRLSPVRSTFSTVPSKYYIYILGFHDYHTV